MSTSQGGATTERTVAAWRVVAACAVLSGARNSEWGANAFGTVVTTTRSTTPRNSLFRTSSTRNPEALFTLRDEEKEEEEEGGESGSPFLDNNSNNNVADKSGFYDVNWDYEDEPDVEGGEERGYYDEADPVIDHDAYGPLPPLNAALGRDEDLILTEKEDRFYESKVEVEKCILVGVEDLAKARRSRVQSRVFRNPEEEQVYFSLDESMTEMRELIKTAGLTLEAELTQRLNEPNPKTYMGTGKLKEAQDIMERHGACTIVFDAELTPGQQKALENTFNKRILQNDFMGAEQAEIKVIDRTALILDIFAQHARTREGKLQVELALHEYRKPRLTRMWTHLERQSGSGGVGLRGPGELQLEIDKRIIRDRIGVLQKKIDEVQTRRDLHRRGRHNLGLPVVALVGYTNAGKSTLLNFLTRAGVMAENILFATLDPTTRRVRLPGYKTHPEVLLTDTVGFIQALPTQLVAAFRATLEEVREADVLVHVVDATNPTHAKQQKAVESTLRTIDAGDKPTVRVLNKIDLLDPDEAEMLKYEAACANEDDDDSSSASRTSVAVSSITGDGMEDFVAQVEEALGSLLVPVEVLIPFARGEELNLVHEVGAVETIDYRENGTYVAGRVPKALAMRLRPFYVSELAPEGTTSTSSAGKDTSDDEIDWVALGRGRHPKKKD